MICSIPLMLLAAMCIKPAESGFRDLRHLDLLDPRYLADFKPGFKIEQLWVPRSCRDGRSHKARAGDFMNQHYVGRLTDGTKFDASYDRNRTYDFYLGIGVVIKGMDMGMTGMCRGEVRRITIPPALGYGNRQIGSIPPNSTLIFEVSLHDMWISPTKSERISGPTKCDRKTAPGDFIRIHYNGTLRNGTSFWSTYDHSTLNFTVGEGRAIKALDLGLLDMCVGERREVTGHHLVAYGKRGRLPSIPPYSTLVFNVELIEIVNGKLKWIKIDGPTCPRNEQLFNRDTVLIQFSGDSANRFRANGNRFRFKIGAGATPKGLDFGMNAMCVGERRRIYIPPEFLPIDIDNSRFPLNQRLVLDVKLLENDFGKPAPAVLPITIKDLVTEALTTLPPTQPPTIPTTQQPATQPPTTRPPTTTLPTTQPPATKPPTTTTQPPATEPPATQPPTTQPPTTRPPTTQPPATQLPTTQPPATQPPTTQPPATQQPITQPTTNHPVFDTRMQTCGGREPYVNLDRWCFDNCNAPVPYCPKSHCMCV